MGAIKNIFFGSPYSLKNYPKQELEMRVPDLKKYFDYHVFRSRFAAMIQSGGLDAVKKYFAKHIEPRNFTYQEIFASDDIQGLMTGSNPTHPLRRIADEQISNFKNIVDEPFWEFSLISEETLYKACSAIGTIIIDGYACALTERTFGSIQRNQDSLIIKTPCRDFLLHITAENWRGGPGADLRATRTYEELIKEDEKADPWSDLLPPLGQSPSDPMWTFSRFFLDCGFYHGCLMWRIQL